MSSLQRATGLLLLVAASSMLTACDTNDGRTLREPAPGATAPPMPTSTSTTAVANPPAGSDEVAALVLTSEAFVEGTAIPARYSCDADDGDDDVSPPIAWTGVPAGTVELAVTMVDPDAPDGPFIHWVLAGIDPSVTGLGEGGVPETVAEIQPWIGPCPPEGETHGYVFTVYALDAPSGLAVGTDAAAALPELEGGTIARGQLTGTYGRPAS